MERDTAAEDAAEKAHWRNVMRNFRNYYKFVASDLQRRQQHLNRLPESYTKRLPQVTFDKLGDISAASQCNQDFFDEIVRYQDQDFQRKNPSDALDQSDKRDTAYAVSFGSQQHRNLAVLHSLFREWSAEGRTERLESFDPIIEELKRCLPITSENILKQRVLVPGCGLARLPLEIASIGYACQGNEFSAFMAIPSNYVLNAVFDRDCFQIYPWLDRVSNVDNAYDVLQKVTIPDVTAEEMLSTTPFLQPEKSVSEFDAHKEKVAKTAGDETDVQSDEAEDLSFPRFSMCLGDFVEIYSGEDNAEFWDAVTTCFFIDTAPVVVEYIDVIYGMLRPGGVWINLGPLLYHWTDDVEGNRDERYGMSIELSWEELKHVLLSYGFEMEQEEWRQCTYTRHKASMMWSTFRCIFFTVRKPLDAKRLHSGPPGTASSRPAESTLPVSPSAISPSAQLAATCDHTREGHP